MTVRSRSPITKRLAGSLLVAVGAAGTTGAAAQGRMVYSLSVPAEIEHDSNPNMTIGNSPSVTWLRVTPGMAARYVTATEEYGVEGALTAEKSSDTNVARDRLDPRLRGVWKHEDEVTTTELAALLDRRAFRGLDVQEHVPVGVDGARTQYAVSGRVRRELNERTAFSGDLTQEWVRYSGTSTPDFRRTSAAVRLTRQQNERRSWYAGVNGQVYRAGDTVDPLLGPARGTRSTVAGALVGVSQALSELWSVDANAGPVHFGGSSSRSGWQGAAKADYKGERWVAGLEVARTPGVNSTFGGLVVANVVRLRMRYDIDPRTQLELNAGHSNERAARSKRSLASVAWVRQLSPAWQVAVRASTHRQEDRVGTARSNRVSLILSYSAPDF